MSNNELINEIIKIIENERISPSSFYNTSQAISLGYTMTNQALDEVIKKINSLKN